MAQPVNTAGVELKPKPRTSSRVSNALKTGVVYGGSAVLTAVNNITPHIAGAVDILVIEQPDGSRKATPFYVRFGKYTALRTRERNVKLYINDELAPFGMHIGMYGQAYFASETVEAREGEDDDEQEALLAGMMSPPSGYSSGTDEPSSQQDGGEAGATLSAVRQRFNGANEARRGAGRSAVSTGPRSLGSQLPVPALGTRVGSSGLPSATMEATAEASSAAASAPASASALTIILDEESAKSSGDQQQQEQQQQKPVVAEAAHQVQLAPALSLTDRNESFLSARETLATPLGDELVACALGGVAPAHLASPEPISSDFQQRPIERLSIGRFQGQGQGLGAVSANSLGSASEGASPCGWSEDEEEGKEEKVAWGAEEAKAGGPASRRGDTSLHPHEQPLPPPLQQHQHRHHHHQPGLQQPLHQQLGFPENVATDAGGVGGAVAPECPAAAGDITGAPAAALLKPVCCGALLRSSFRTGLDLGCSTGTMEPQLEVGSRLNVTVEWARLPGSAAWGEPLPGPSIARQASASSIATVGPVPGAVAIAAPLPLQPMETSLDAAATTQDATPRLGPCDAVAVQRSPSGGGMGPAAASAAAATVDGHGCSAGPGSHSAVSLLSSSLRTGGGGGFHGGMDARLAPPGGESRSTLDWHRAKGNGAAAAPSEFLQVPIIAAGVGGGVMPAAGLGSVAADGPVGPIAAAAVASASAAAAVGARLKLAADLPPAEERGTALSLSVTLDGSVKVSLRALAPPVPAPTGAGPTMALQGLDGGFGSIGMEVLAAEHSSASGNGGIYHRDTERGKAGGAASTHISRQHHHGGHHNHHYHYAHGRQDNNELLHSTSAPQPSVSIHAAVAAGGTAGALGDPTAGAPAVSAAAAAAVARGGGAGGVGTMPLAHGIELSLCGGHLTSSMSYATASAFFDAHRLSEEAFFSGAQQVSGAAELTIRLSNGVIFPCQPLSHSLLGLLAFGAWRLPPGTPCWAPESAGVAEASEAAATSAAAAAAAAMLAAAMAQGVGVAAGDAPKNGATGANSSTATTPKKGQGGAGMGGGSWRLWMFGARREGARTSLTGAGGGGGAAAAAVSGRSPPLTSPITERPSSVEHRPSSVDPAVAATAAPPLSPLPAVGTALVQLQPGQPSAAEGDAVASAAAADTAAGGPLQPAGGSIGGGGASGARGGGRRPGYNVVTKKSLTPTGEQLAALPLQHGQNTVTYKVGASELRAYVYFLPWRTRIVISDIDGTITKSDVLGHLLPAMGLDWSHPGIAKLLTNIRQNSYLIMYLSSRSISQANITRDFINTLVQGEHRMPLGPVIISPHGLLPSLYREMILRRPHEFKIATLQDIRALFPPHWNPFYGGFGNRDTDEISYREVGVQPSRIFIINPRGELRQPVDSASRAEPLASAATSASASAAVTGTAAATLTAASDDAAKGQGQGDAASGGDPTCVTGGGGVEQPVDAAALPTLVAAAATTRDAFGRGAVSTVSRRGSGGTTAIVTMTVQLSTLSAINELVHDIFPPLRDGHPVTEEAEEQAGGSSSEATRRDWGDGGAVAVGACDDTEPRSGEGGREDEGEGSRGRARGCSVSVEGGSQALSAEDADQQPNGSAGSGGGEGGITAARAGNTDDGGDRGACDTVQNLQRESSSGTEEKKAKRVGSEEEEEKELRGCTSACGLVVTAPAVTTPRSAASPRSASRTANRDADANVTGATASRATPIAPPTVLQEECSPSLSLSLSPGHPADCQSCERPQGPSSSGAQAAAKAAPLAARGCDSSREQSSTLKLVGGVGVEDCSRGAGGGGGGRTAAVASGGVGQGQQLGAGACSSGSGSGNRPSSGPGAASGILDEVVTPALPLPA